MGDLRQITNRDSEFELRETHSKCQTFTIPSVRVGVHSSSDAVSGFQYAHRVAERSKFARSCTARHTGAENQDGATRCA
jgi:hypothetical protein